MFAFSQSGCLVLRKEGEIMAKKIRCGGKEAQPSHFNDNLLGVLTPPR